MSNGIPPCPSCQAFFKTSNKDVNSVLRIPVCNICMENFYSESPENKRLNETFDRLADELHDYINQVWPNH